MYVSTHCLEQLQAPARSPPQWCLFCESVVVERRTAEPVQTQIEGILYQISDIVIYHNTTNIQSYTVHTCILSIWRFNECLSELSVSRVVCF